MSSCPDTSNKGSRLPTRTQLQAEAFGLSPRTPEWMRTLRSGSKPPASVPPSADASWVVAANSADGWRLDKAAELFARHGIPSEVDVPAGLLRVERCAFRAACNLLRVHRRSLRTSRAAKEPGTVDGRLLGLVGPPLLLGSITIALLAALMTDASGPNPLLAAAAFGLLSLSVFFTVRAGSAGLCWLMARRSAFDADPHRRDDADYPPAP